MRWLLALHCGLALISVALTREALTREDVVKQIPRFYGLRPGRFVFINCLSSNPSDNVTVEWYKATVDDTGDKTKITASDRIKMISDTKTKGSKLFIDKLQVEDTGVYFCKIDTKYGAGTGLQVAKTYIMANAEHRSRMKDAIMIFQALVLAMCLAALLRRKHQLRKEKDCIYEEPDTDHIYEGLQIETCGGLYEELSVYTHPAEEAEAPWE
ncbi:uncharacterized protein cd79b [Scomber scombrus]|uniref:uncharacterized protein cd79b n=1 Tax=Scomber scombrus TaxID=13677 RepID=UPI002DDC2B6A|nr:uncharacterized protein cd79b [Scomber scombrus]